MRMYEYSNVYRWTEKEGLPRKIVRCWHRKIQYNILHLIFFLIFQFPLFSPFLSSFSLFAPPKTWVSLPHQGTLLVFSPPSDCHRLPPRRGGASGTGFKKRNTRPRRAAIWSRKPQWSCRVIQVTICDHHRKPTEFLRFCGMLMNASKLLL